jgi:hypothetical protein
MSEESDEHLRTLFDRQRALCQRAMTQKLSKAEEAALVAEIRSIGKEIELVSGCTVTVVDPIESAREDAKAAFDAHYRRKAELDRKLFGEPPNDPFP